MRTVTARCRRRTCPLLIGALHRAGWAALAVLSIGGANAIADQPFRVIIPPADPLNPPSSPETLRLPPTYPDTNCDHQLNPPEVFAYLQAVIDLGPDSGDLPIFDPNDSESLGQRKIVALVNGMLRMVVRPGDFQIKPNGGQIWDQPPAPCVPDPWTTDPTASPCWDPNPSGPPPEPPTCSDALRAVNLLSQYYFGKTLNPTLLPTIDVPSPIDADHCPAQPPDPMPNHTNPCDVPEVSPSPTGPMPFGDGPGMCASVVEWDAGCQCYRNPCDGTPIYTEPSAPLLPDIHWCSGVTTGPCAVPVVPSEPSPFPVDDGFHCSGLNPCIDPCAQTPCDHGDPPIEPDPRTVCSGVCDVPDMPGPPHDRVPDPGTDPNAIYNPPIEPRPKEREPLTICGGIEGAVPQSNNTSSGAGESLAKSCRPVDLVHSYKMESETDLTLELTGRDFHFVRSYTTNPTQLQRPSELGPGWSSPIFRRLVVTGTTTQTLTMLGASGGRTSRFYQVGTSGTWRPNGPSRNLAIIDTNVVRYVEPGEGVTEFYRSTTSPLNGCIKSMRDEHGNLWTFEYRTFQDGTPLVARLHRIYLNGTSGTDAEAMVEFGYYLGPTTGDPAPAPRDLLGRLARVVTYRRLAGVTDWYETHRAEYTYKHDGDPFSPDVGTNGDLIQVVKYSRVDRTAPDGFESVSQPRTFGPGYPHRASVLQYRYHRAAHDPAVTAEDFGSGGPTIEGLNHQLKSVFRPEQLEYFAELLYRDNTVLGGKSYSVRDAACRLMLLPDYSMAVSRGDESYRVDQIASKIVGYEPSTGNPSRVKVQYAQAGCGCSGGGSQTIKEEFTYRSTSSSPDFWKSAEIVTSTRGTSSWSAYTTRWVDSRKYTVSPSGGVATEPYLMVNDVLKEGAPSGSGRKWVHSYEYDSSYRVAVAVSPAANATRTYTPATSSAVPTLTSGASGNAPTAGSAAYYEYNSENRLTTSGVRTYGSTGTASDQPVVQITYVSGHTHLPATITRIAGTGGASNEEVTTFAYSFYASGGGVGDHAIRWVKTTVETEAVAENGTGSSSGHSSAVLLDSQGRPEFSISASGLVSRFEYENQASGGAPRDTSGKVWRVTTNAGTSVLPTGGDYSGVTSIAVSNSEPAYVYSTERDAVGRVRRSTGPGLTTSDFITTEWAYEASKVTEDPSQRVGVRYMCYINLPFRLPDTTYSGSAMVVWSDAAEGTLLAKRVAPATFTSGDEGLPLNVVTVGSSSDESALNTHLNIRLGEGSTLIGKRNATLTLAGQVRAMTGWQDVTGGRPAYTTTFEYDELGRPFRSTSVQGTISLDTYDVHGRVIKREYGTSAGLEMSGEYFYDSGSGTTQGVGNGNLTVSVGYTGEATGGARTRVFIYDIRDRLIGVKNALPPHSIFTYDNLDRVVESADLSSDSGLPSAGGSAATTMGDSRTNRARYVKRFYSQRGLTYKAAVAIDPTVVESSRTFLEFHVWRDAPGRPVASWGPDSPASKVVYDALGRLKTSYTTNRGGDIAPGASGSHGAALALTGDTVLEQTEYTYHTTLGALSFIKHMVMRHDAPTGAGALTNETVGSTPPSAVATYAGYIYDQAGRVIRTVNFGTNKAPDLTSTSAGAELNDTFSNAAAPSWSQSPSTVPAWNTSGWENHIISAVRYGPRGLPIESIDPLGRKGRVLYDDLDRVIARIENYTGSGDPSATWEDSTKLWAISPAPSSSTPDENRTTSYSHFQSGNDWIVRQAAHTGGGGSGVQATDYVHGVSNGANTEPANTLIPSADWLREVRYPQESGSAAGMPGTSAEFKVLYAYNMQGELRYAKDQNATEHAYTRDLLGRVLRDKASATASSIHNAVAAIDAAYDDLGRLTNVKSLGVSGGGWTGTLAVRDHVRYTYDVLDRITAVEQDIDSDMTTTPTGHGARTVSYGHGTAAINATVAPRNQSRLTGIGYPSFALPGDSTPPTTTLKIGYDGDSPWLIHAADGKIARPTSLGLRDSEIVGEDVSNTDRLIAEYDYIGLGMAAHVDFPLINVALDRTVDVLGKRIYGSTQSQAKATYPGYDRFGRVKRQAWVPLGYDTNGGGTAPNRRENVNLVYAYDKVGNPIARQQARQGSGYNGRWADRDWEYHHDGLDRLTLARRGVLTVAGPGFGGTFSADPNSTSNARPQLNTLARGSQKWKLDHLGNWAEFLIDIRTDGSTDTPNAAFDGTGFDSTLEKQSRTHNEANELGAITVPTVTVPTGAAFVAAPLLMPMSYTHDDAGNRLTADNGVTGTGQVKHQFIYDAWNRLVRIDKYDTSESDWDAIAAYRYNGLHWRTRKYAHSTPDAATGKETVFTYNASWQAILEEIDEDHTTGGSGNQVDRVVQQIFGLRGVNDAIYRREDHKYAVPAQNIWNEEETEIIETIPGYTQECDGLYEKSFYQLADAQGSIVSVVTVGVLVLEPNRSYGAKQTVDWVEYDPYGRSRRWSKADHNMNGSLDAGDISGSFLNAYFAGDMSADQNESGTISVSDIFAHQGDWFAGDATAKDWLSHAMVDNPYGYCGYYADKETLGINGVDNGFLYQCRYRVYDPLSGRWLQRDPAGFVDGMNLYEYVSGNSTRYVDPLGLGAVGWLIRAAAWGWKKVAKEAAEKALKEGDDVLVEASTKKTAKSKAKNLAKKEFGDKTAHHGPHNEGQMPHYQHKNGGRGHVFYRDAGAAAGAVAAGAAAANGQPTYADEMAYGADVAEDWVTAKGWIGDNVVSTIIDFFNPASNVVDIARIASDVVNALTGKGKEESDPENESGGDGSEDDSGNGSPNGSGQGGPAGGEGKAPSGTVVDPSTLCRRTE